MVNPIQYIFLNKSLHMSTGKAAAQAVHAANMASVDINKEEQFKSWSFATHKTVIVLEARDESHMRNIIRYLNDRQVQLASVVDEGVNEIDPHTITALATGFLDKDDEETIKALSTFKLYREIAKFTVEFER